jgi:hypothetical protein
MDKLTATYDQDSKRFHRYVIDEGQGIVGNIYIPKNEDVPDEIAISLETPGGKKREEKGLQG